MVEEEVSFLGRRIFNIIVSEYGNDCFCFFLNKFTVIELGKRDDDI